jgi:hypothetical protein
MKSRPWALRDFKVDRWIWLMTGAADVMMDCSLDAVQG